jgi:hypothetical protein
VQTMKKAEGQLEKERVLKKANTRPGNNGNGGVGNERVKSTSKAVRGTNGAGGPGSVRKTAITSSK